MTTIAELHERLGELIADGSGRIEGMEGRVWRTRETHLSGLEIDDYIRRVKPVALPDTPDIRALQASWDEDTRLLGEAYDRFCKHRCVKTYRRECGEIIGRDDALALASPDEGES